MDLDEDILDEMEQWLNKKHYETHVIGACSKLNGTEQLVQEKQTLKRHLPILHSFERAIASIEHQSQNLIANSVTSHAIERTKAELFCV